MIIFIIDYKQKWILFKTTVIQKYHKLLPADFNLTTTRLKIPSHDDL